MGQALLSKKEVKPLERTNQLLEEALHIVKQEGDE